MLLFFSASQPCKFHLSLYFIYPFPSPIPTPISPSPIFILFVTPLKWDYMYKKLLPWLSSSCSILHMFVFVQYFTHGHPLLKNVMPPLNICNDRLNSHHPKYIFQLLPLPYTPPSLLGCIRPTTYQTPCVILIGSLT